ncbi:hypothetical protein MRQ86_00185 [Streptomyces sp. MMS21 TC-5]|uniref:hypothetical protein n=1 Tax=Streptomyces sp. MMS21 TC-5 TaxID=2925833 RepID=UPI001F6205C6|nr:hypothetical protein [Streptomyces sp. MMS21 TC-5]MCI4078797.1 hypothetical protein [Streptomyces sp. MMS21 TC-5]
MTRINQTRLFVMLGASTALAAGGALLPVSAFAASPASVQEAQRTYQTRSDHGRDSQGDHGERGEKGHHGDRSGKGDGRGDKQGRKTGASRISNEPGCWFIEETSVKACEVKAEPPKQIPSLKYLDKFQKKQRKPALEHLDKFKKPRRVPGPLRVPGS